MVTRGTRGGVPELSASGDRGRQDVGLVRIRRSLHRRCEVRRARPGQHGRPRKHPRVDCFDDEHLPGSEMPVYPVEWYSIDTDKGWVIFKNVNTLKDPGDGSVHGAPVITVLEYAGDDKWSYERGRVQPDELRGDVAGLRSAVSRTGHTVRRREDVRQEHELGTDLTYYARAAEDWPVASVDENCPNESRSRLDRAHGSMSSSRPAARG